MKNIPVRKISINKSVPDISGTFVIRDLEPLLSEKDMLQELHRHDYFYILVLEKGKGSHVIDFTAYNVSDHSVFFLRPGQVHQLSLKSGSKGYLIQFNSAFYYPKDKESGQLLRKAGNKNLCQLHVNGITKLLKIMATVLQEYTDKQEGYLEVIKASLGIFFIELVRHRQSYPKVLAEENLYNQERLDELLELIGRNISAHKQVSEYAEMMHLSTYQLNAITKETLGKTCSKLINESILLEAKRYLLATSNQISQIAYHLGYDDVSYFIRFFKKHSGFSPEAFRLKFK